MPPCVTPVGQTRLPRLCHDQRTGRARRDSAALQWIASALARCGANAALHHERLDGSGYYGAVTGAAIPQTARILAAAGVYQALTED